MKAISIRQPWAWLIVHGHKDVENRTWQTKHRGPFLVHASKGMTRREYEEARQLAGRLGVTIPVFGDLKLGGIVGQASITHCSRGLLGVHSPWFCGPYGFHLKDAKPLPFRPCAGRLGFFEVEWPVTPDAAFEADIPEELRDDVMLAIAEAAHQGEGIHGCVHILEQDRLDAINVRAQGVVTVACREYWFIVEDGNRAGTVLVGWEGSGAQTFEPATRTQWALAPSPDAVGVALRAGKGQLLVAKWDALLTQPAVAKIPTDYAYDRMMQPGLKVERHYKAAARKRGFVLTNAEDAADIRRRLMSAGNWRGSNP